LEEVITILKNLGSSISLKAGENVNAEVVDVLPSGAAVLRIKNSYITVNTEIPLSKDKNLVENLKELKKIATERLKDNNINVVSFDVYG